MTLLLAKNSILVLAIAVFAFGSVVQAQEETIEVEVGSFESETTDKILQEQRKVFERSKSDISRILNDLIEEQKIIKQEQTRTLKVNKKSKSPVFNERKTLPKEKEFPRGPASSSDSETIYVEPKIIESRKPREQEILLNLNERQRRADIESARREKIIRAQNTEFGRLKAEMGKSPLKSYQAKLTQFSDKINNLQGQLQRKGGSQRTVFLDLGNTHLESQRYLNSLSPNERLKLTLYASYSGTTLGSYESALWVLKMALVRNPNDAETNLLLSKILSEMGERDLALRRARNAEVLFVKNNQPNRAVQTQSFIESLKNSFPEN